MGTNIVGREKFATKIENGDVRLADDDFFRLVFGNFGGLGDQVLLSHVSSRKRRRPQSV